MQGSETVVSSTPEELANSAAFGTENEAPLQVPGNGGSSPAAIENH